MSAQHTPGPWRVSHWGAAIVSDHPVDDGMNGSDCVEYYGGHLIAESISSCNRPLIAAAPDYFQAAEAVLAEARRLSGTSAAHCGGLLRAVHALGKVHAQVKGGAA